MTTSELAKKITEERDKVIFATGTGQCQSWDGYRNRSGYVAALEWVLDQMRERPDNRKPDEAKKENA